MASDCWFISTKMKIIQNDLIYCKYQKSLVQSLVLQLPPKIQNLHLGLIGHSKPELVSYKGCILPSSNVNWDRLQQTHNPVKRLSGRRWVDGWLIICFTTLVIYPLYPRGLQHVSRTCLILHFTSGMLGMSQYQTCSSRCKYH